MYVYRLKEELIYKTFNDRVISLELVKKEGRNKEKLFSNELKKKKATELEKELYCVVREKNILQPVTIKEIIDRDEITLKLIYLEVEYYPFDYIIEELENKTGKNLISLKNNLLSVDDISLSEKGSKLILSLNSTNISFSFPNNSEIHILLNSLYSLFQKFPCHL